MKFETQTDEVVITELRGFKIEHWVCTLWQHSTGVYQPCVFYLKLENREWSRYCVDAWLLHWFEYPLIDDFDPSHEMSVNIAKKYALTGRSIDIITMEQVTVNDKPTGRLSIKLIDGPTLVLDDDDDDYSELRIIRDHKSEVVNEKAHMCFLLYLGTDKPMPTIPFSESSPSFNTSSINNNDDQKVKQHFSFEYVTETGSDTYCGCGYRHSTDEFGAFDYEPSSEDNGQDNHIALVDYIKSNVTSPTVELYGCFDGDLLDKPVSTETIELDDILKEDFCFRVGFLYIVKIS